MSTTPHGGPIIRGLGLRVLVVVVVRPSLRPLGAGPPDSGFPGAQPSTPGVGVCRWSCTWGTQLPAGLGAPGHPHAQSPSPCHATPKGPSSWRTS